MSERDPKVEVTESVSDSSVPAEEPENGAVAQAEAAIQQDIQQIARERDDYLDALKRLQADFENYKKRILKQQTEHLERANEGLIVKLLEVLDVLDGAQAHGEGFEQVGARLVGVLAKEGLERVDPMGRAFDPNEADAVAHEPAPPGQPEGAQVVSAVLRPGYRWKGRVVRPAMVKVTG
jgi:molecular chaperone GrpE